MQKGRIRKFFARLLSLRNVAPLTIIVVAVLGAVFPSLLGSRISTEQIIMALLAFIAIDAMVERLDILSKIESGVENIQTTVTPDLYAASFFKKRKEFPRMEMLINQGQNDIWVAGITLSTMTTLTQTYELKKERGCNIRFLALDPKGKLLIPIAEFLGDSPEILISRINNNLTTLKARLERVEKGGLEIKVIDQMLPNGYFITDPHTQDAYMIVQEFMYRGGSETSALFELHKQKDSAWFDAYLLQYERLWNDAKVFIPE